jgi:hypothetical protein
MTMCIMGSRSLGRPYMLRASSADVACRDAGDMSALVQHAYR